MITIVPKTTEARKVEPLAVCAAEAAVMLGVSPRTLWKLTKEKRVPSVKIERRVLYSVEALRRFVNGSAANDKG